MGWIDWLTDEFVDWFGLVDSCKVFGEWLFLLPSGSHFLDWLDPVG